MSKLIRAAGLCVAMLLTRAPGVSTQASIQFQSVDLGAIGPDVMIAGLSNHGYIAAHGYDPNAGSVRCWLHDGSRWTSFGLGGQDCYAADINDAGMVVGYAQLPTGDYHPFLYANGLVSDLGTLDGMSAYALAINASGAVVGYSDIAGGTMHGFIYENGVMRDLDPQCALTTANDINDAGQITGYRSCDFGPNEAFRYQNGTFEPITIQPDGVRSCAAHRRQHGVVGRILQRCDG
jgi:probable HAF family extracellular repeat protein